MAKLKTAYVIFEDSKHNYYTSVSGCLTDQQIKDYFIGMSINVAPYPQEVFKTCIACNVS